MIKLEDAVKIITSDLKLNGSEQIEFESQFMQLFIYNLLLDIPDQYKEVVKEASSDDVIKNQQLIIEKITSLGITSEQSRDLIDNSLRKSISEVVQKYNDVLSGEIKEKLQSYI